jgi:hypothetical protein
MVESVQTGLKTPREGEFNIRLTRLERKSQGRAIQAFQGEGSKKRTSAISRSKEEI